MSVAILNLTMAHDNQAGARTVRDYLKALLIELWDQGEGFSGKRPFGNGGWEYDLYYVLVSEGFVSGRIDAYGDVVDVDTIHAGRLIDQAIKSL
jgi:hypothetical protein